MKTKILSLGIAILFCLFIAWLATTPSYSECIHELKQTGVVDINGDTLLYSNGFDLYSSQEVKYMKRLENHFIIRTW